MIREKNGIHIQRDRNFVADGTSGEGDVNIVTHAHSDHALKKKTDNVVCSELTGKIVEERFGVSHEFSERHDRVELIPSGHIIGSRAALIDDEVLYTGDVSLQGRLYMEGFKPVEAEELIVETTYGIPAYRFPSQKEVVKRTKDWIKDNEDEPLFLFGYSLGKAQKIQKIVQKATERPIIAHGAVKKMNDAVEKNTGLEFRAKSYKENKDLLEEGAVMIAPSRCSRADFVDKLVEKHGGLKAGFSGWAATDSFKYRGGYDATFQLSDHCDFDDLVELVKDVDPEKVYTQHGFDEAFASHLSRELGFNARALKNNQASLTDF